MLFWILIGGLTLGICAILGLTLLRGRVGDDAPAAYDLRVYRDQLKEVDRDLARGVISAEDAERNKAEIGRKILTADAQLREGGAQGGQPMGQFGLIVAVVSAIALGGAAFGLYQRLGAPGYPDLALSDRIDRAEELRKSRPSQAVAQAEVARSLQVAEPRAEFVELMEKLRAAVAERPDDVRGLALLARNEAMLGNFDAAMTAQAQLIEALGDDVQASDYTDYADLMVLATNGYVSPEAEQALLKALSMDPNDGVAQYYLGLLFSQIGRPDAAFQTWNKLLRESPPDARWLPPIRAQIGEVAVLAGVDFVPPAAPAAPAPALPGPTTEDMQAASEMDAEDRQEMIRGMVERLGERLAAEGGPPQEWARLINALAVLGQTKRATAIWDEAQKAFWDAPESLALINQAAQSAGLSK